MNPAPVFQILVVDDEPDYCDTLRELLIQEGYQVHIAFDAETAERIAHQHELHLILADIHMPEVDGVALLRSMRRNEELSIIPFVFITSVSGQSRLREALRWGADDILSKSSSREEILDLVRELLSRPR